MHTILEKLLQKQDLSGQEIQEVFQALFEGKLSEIFISAFLVALRGKGETSTELLEIVRVMRSYMTTVQCDDANAIDTCGTGGAAYKTGNVSSMSALVLASGGVTVAKHGNRSNTSASGSADFLESLGISLNLPKEQAEASLKNHQFSFLFAPLYHPAMKYVVPVRKELKIKTVFNMVGPLANPARVQRQVTGVHSKNLQTMYMEVMRHLGMKRAIIVHGTDGIDEFSLSAPSEYVLIEGNQCTEYTVTPEDFGLKTCLKEEVLGGNPKENVEKALEILGGKDRGARSDIVALNAGAGFFVAEKVQSLQEGVKMAQDILRSGRVLEKIQDLTNTSL